jgi:hypothetical protein
VAERGAFSTIFVDLIRDYVQIFHLLDRILTVCYSPRVFR